jgi:hypothetical protein
MSSLGSSFRRERHYVILKNAKGVLVRRKIISLSIVCLFFVQCTGGDSGSTVSSPGPGATSRDFLSDQTYTNLVVEIQAVSGFAPSAGAQTQLVTFLNTYLNKPGGITVQVDAPLASPGKTSYSLDDVRAIEAANRVSYASGTQAVAYFLFLDGASTSDSSSGQILGIAHGPSSIVMMGGTIHASSGALGQPSRQVLETTVMQHEFGHLLGLTNTGTPMVAPHQDSAHGAHCSNTSCLMYWQVDTSNFLGNLLGGTVPSLDAGCIADLHANGGK